jgi:hypothetical protein
MLLLTACAVAVFLALASSALVPAEGQEDQHKAWGEMKHSKAFDVLTADQIKDGKDDKGRACVSCHTTGYGKPTGFVSVEKTEKLKHVGCESCHGAGSQHKAIMFAAMDSDEVPTEKKISKSVGCAGCHNPHISYKKKYGK